MSYSVFASVYDVLTENVEYKKRADYFCSLLSESGINGGLLLDLACGTGTLSSLFAERGYSVIGVDLSEEMLSIAQQKLAEKPQDILYLCQDMRSLDLYGTIDCCVCALDSLNHLTSEDDLLKAFKNVSLFLNDSGLFLFDLNTVYKHKSVLSGNSFVYDLPSVYCVWQNGNVTQNNTVKINLDFFIQGEDGLYERFCECFSERAYEREKVAELLEKADFDIVNIYDELSRSAPTDKSERVVYIARRRKRK